MDVEEVLGMQSSLALEDVAEDTQSGRIASRMNWLRAGVMGANDGIVSTAGMSPLDVTLAGHLVQM